MISYVIIGTKKLFTTSTFAGVGISSIGKWMTTERLYIKLSSWFKTPYKNIESPTFMAANVPTTVCTVYPIYSDTLTASEFLSYGLMFELIVKLGLTKFWVVWKTSVSYGKNGEISTVDSKSS